MIDEKLRTSLKECPNTRAGVKKKKKELRKKRTIAYTVHII